MMFVGGLFILMGIHVLNVFNNQTNGLFLIAIGVALIYGRIKIAK